MGWKAIDLILSDSTRKKITLTSENSDPELVEMTDAYQLEEKYGGTSPNLTKFWPPVMPKAPC
jgi:hypothetical protein